MESDERYYRRRASEELAAAERSVTPAARDRRVQLAQSFLERLNGPDTGKIFFAQASLRGGGLQGRSDALRRRRA